MTNNYKKYLELESLLNKLFNKTNFCINHCINKWATTWCCNKNYFNDFYVDFNHKRIKLYNNPIRWNKICWYHTPTWCKLNTHKSPICLWFICSPYINYLKSFWIEWNWNEIIKILGEIIEQNFTNYKYLKNKLIWFINLIQD